MNRRQLAFLVLVNGIVSLVVALGVVWLFEARRPDLEELAALYTPQVQPIIAAAPTENPAAPVSTPLPEGDAGTDSQAIATTAAEPQVVESGAADDEQEVYIVQAGDSLVAIATRFNLTVDDIVEANNLTNPDFLFSGQRLVIPTSGSAIGGEAANPPTPTPNINGAQIGRVENPGDLTNETVLIINESNDPFSLQGWTLTSTGGPTYTFGNVPLFPGGSVRLHSTSGVDTSIDLYWGQEQPIWSSGAVVELQNGEGTLVRSYTIP